MVRKVKDESGQILIIVALLMSAFLALLALVIDGGNLYLERNRLQKAVDASALAGAQDLPTFPNRAREQAEYTAFHNQEIDNLTIEIPSGNTSIYVHANKEVNLIFANAIGFSDPIIEAEATVSLYPLSSAKGAIPLGVEYNTDLAYGTRKSLKVGESTVGNFGALALTGPGAKDYETDLKYGYEFTIKVGERLDTQTGNIAGPTKKAIDYRLSGCPNETYENFSTDCSRVVLVPVFRPITTSENQVKSVEIIGFATFFLESVTSTSDGAEVFGRFIRTTHIGELNENQTDYGTYGYKLTQ
ncbi:Tad domain-containing protein [Salirhabdus salicampi]|uniref:Tad domain-containing protein n=1 Tax=Salirhabdus salicampi TaxID=476102 RepID=UPI0020C4D65F|nr:Tad domain-containing protein [Salirhabdus salicampi]MCP8616132.1 Tad domain-containing protein [Salirhabdus salicampi]